MNCRSKQGLNFSNILTSKLSILNANDMKSLSAQLDGGYPEECFGLEVSISGNGLYLVIGSFAASPNGFPYQGSTNIYRNIDGEWINFAQFHGEDAYSYVGLKVAISRDGKFFQCLRWSMMPAVFVCMS